MAAASMNRRLSVLEGSRTFATIGELLDSLDGAPLPSDRRVSPELEAALEGMADA